MRWEAINQPRITWMTHEQRDQEYERFRFAEWERSNAERIALKSPGQRHEMFRSEDMLDRYRAGLPARNDEEREAYQIWRELGLDAAEDYRHGVLMPQQDYGPGEGPPDREPAAGRVERRQGGTTKPAPAPGSTWLVAREETEAVGRGGLLGAFEAGTAAGKGTAQAAAPQRATGWRPGSAGAGSGLEDGPLTRRAPLRPAQGDDGIDAGPPRPDMPGNFRPPDPVPPGRGQAPSGPVPW